MYTYHDPEPEPKEYEAPEIIWEDDLETRAGSVPESDPFTIEE